MSDTAVLLARVSSVLTRIGLERRFVNSILVDVCPGTAQHEGLTIWRDSLERWHHEVLGAFVAWKNGDQVLDLLDTLNLWDERSSGCTDLPETEGP